MAHKRYCLAPFSNVAIERGELLLLLLILAVAALVVVFRRVIMLNA